MIKRLLLCFVFLLCGTLSGYAQNWKEYKGTYFIIYYNEAPFDFVQEVEKAAQQYYTDISRNLGFTRYKGWTWDERAKIYIYDSADDYVTTGRQSGWSHGVASPKDKVIRTFPTAHGFFDSTLPHELGHIIFREFVGFDAEVPLWFEEGVAMIQERARRWGVDEEVKKAIKDGTFIPLDELSLLSLNSRTNIETVNLFYAEAASVINYLMNEQGASRFERFCRELKDGDPFNWALEKIYIRFKNTKQLNDAWVKHLTR